MAISTEDRLKRQLQRSGPWLLAGLLLYWFAPTWIWHVRRTWDTFTFNDDARILIWPFLRDADPSLFPDDPFTAYYLAGLPEGYLAFYHLVGRLGWVKATSEALQYLSVLSVAVILAATARRLGGTMAGFLAAALVLGSGTFFERAGGGLPRAFAFPLVSAGLYALVAVRPRLLAGLVIAGAAFYPVVAALLGLGLLLLLILPERFRRDENAPPCDREWQKSAPCASLRARSVLLGITLACTVALVAPMSLRLRAHGAQITPAMLSDFPEAGPGGRLTRDQRPPFEDFATVFARHTRGALLGQGVPMTGRVGTWLRRTNQRTNLTLSLIVTAAAIRLAVGARNRSSLARPWLLLLAALIGHWLACLLAPRLFLPERYVQYGVPPLIVLLVASGIGGCLAKKAPSGYAWALPGMAAALLLTLIGAKGSSWSGIEVYVPPGERPLYAEIARLPVHVVIAGWPAGPAENIPYLSERRVLTNFQLEMPFHTRFTLQSRTRLRALFEAYFATSSGPIERLCSEFNVTHFVVNPKHFLAARPHYYAPHRAELEELFERSDTAKASLLRFLSHPSTRHFEGGVGLIELSQIPELAPACSNRQSP